MASARRGRSGSSENRSSLHNMLSSIKRERSRVQRGDSGEGGFVVLAINTFWTKVFSEYLVDSGSDDLRDDMLFFIRKISHARDQQPVTEVDVYRRDSKRLPSPGDPSIDWEETVYLNLILQQVFSEYLVDSGSDDLRDDMLFFIRKISHARDQQPVTEVDVYRRDSKRLPSPGDPSIDWEETVYLNLILQQESRGHGRNSNGAMSHSLSQPTDMKKSTSLNERADFDRIQGKDRRQGPRDGSSRGVAKAGGAFSWLKGRQRSSGGLFVLNAHLTYVTLPWQRIVADILENRQPPVLSA
uniref:Uncharacterized protein n=1 Tax=Branchiostoma floridae TaxID=7739 RepID=C3Y530_BRAFL|eukprot:XP_002608553.1 hypothetical protein BRAFLDRAFT_128829 [Branchiostoma floridae]